MSLSGADPAIALTYGRAVLTIEHVGVRAGAGFLPGVVGPQRAWLCRRT